MKDREVPPGMKEKWKMLIRLFVVLCFLFPNVLDYIRKILNKCDFSKLVPDQDDLYYLYMRRDYNFGGIDFETRYAKKVAIDIAYFQETGEDCHIATTNPEVLEKIKSQEAENNK